MSGYWIFPVSERCKTITKRLVRLNVCDVIWKYTRQNRLFIPLRLKRTWRMARAQMRSNKIKIFKNSRFWYMSRTGKGWERVCVYVVFYTFCIMMVLCQDDKIWMWVSLAEIIKSAHLKRKKNLLFLFWVRHLGGLNLVCRREDLFSWLKIVLLKNVWFSSPDIFKTWFSDSVWIKEASEHKFKKLQPFITI